MVRGERPREGSTRPVPAAGNPDPARTVGVHDLHRVGPAYDRALIHEERITGGTRGDSRAIGIYHLGEDGLIDRVRFLG